MNIPPGMAESQVLEAIDKVVDVLCASFDGRLPSMTRDDLAQEIRLMSIQALARGKYDPGRPLAPFLFSNAKNRILNMLRDKCHRTDSPCRQCSDGDFCGDGRPCPAFKKWRERNQAKSRLAWTCSIDWVADADEPRMRQADYAGGNELSEVIDRELPVEFRGDYLRALAGERLRKPRRLQVQKAVWAVLEAAGFDADELGIVVEQPTPLPAKAAA